MKLRILDLLILTALVGAITASFRSDLELFRGLSMITLILAGSVTWLWIRKRPGWLRLGGALGGLGGAVIYLAVTGLARYWVFESREAFEVLDPPRFAADQVTDEWVLSCVWVPLVGLFLGATAGPMLLVYLLRVPLLKECRIQWRVSWLLLAGFIGLLGFESLDRLKSGLGGRDWAPFRTLLLLVFVVHTLIWLRRLEGTDDHSIPTDDWNDTDRYMPERES